MLRTMTLERPSDQVFPSHTHGLGSEMLFECTYHIVEGYLPQGPSFFHG